MQTFRQEADQQRFGLAHRLKRALLARLMNCDPLALNFIYNAAGKPALSQTCSTVQFNLSHSGPMVILALSRSGSIGCDVQFMPTTITQTMTLPTELLYHPDDPVAQDPRKRFLSCWSQKEAICKAEGSGLQIPLTQLPLYPDQQPVADPLSSHDIGRTGYEPGREQQSYSEWQQKRWYCRHRAIKYGSNEGWLAIAQAQPLPVHYFLVSDKE